MFHMHNVQNTILGIKQNASSKFSQDMEILFLIGLKLYDAAVLKPINKHFSKLMFDVIKQFPNISKFTSDIVMECFEEQANAGGSVPQLRGEEKTHGILSFQKLECINLQFVWATPAQLFAMNFPVIWDLISLNAGTMKCLRIFFLAWTPPICANEGLITEPAFRNAYGYINALQILFKVPYFCTSIARLPQFNLEVLQLESFGNCTFLPTSRLLRPETLKVLSLVFCHDVYAMLFEISTELKSLECLQVVEIQSDISLLGKSLRRLPPLKALYIAMIQKSDRLDVGCLDKHRSSIKRLVLLTGGESPWFGGPYSALRRSSLGRAKHKVNFREWKKLEELTFHCGGELPTFYIPTSLKFLSVVDPSSNAQEGDPTCVYNEFLRNLTKQQMNMTKNRVWGLQAVIISSALCLPDYVGKGFKILETAAVAPIADSNGRIHKPELKVSVLELDVFRWKFPGTSIVRQDSRSRNWIDEFV
ncbi:hypothetical protein TWF718_001599 [Orbilia javanica]|uniref:Uncharacterized protein n=1 Tax=Orbilia javanica TaxID=47235 RepID=A0AAN8P2R3_9PEZI